MANDLTNPMQRIVVACSTRVGAAARVLAYLPRLVVQPAELRDDRPALPRRAARRWHSRRQGRGRAGCPQRELPRGVGCKRRQCLLRIKSLLGYAHKLGYTRFNAAATIKVKSDLKSRRANLAKRIITPTEVSLLIRAARSRRDRVLPQVGYAGGLRVSELVGLTWSDVLERDGRVRLSVTGKGGVLRQVLLPAGRCCRCAVTLPPLIHCFRAPWAVAR